MCSSRLKCAADGKLEKSSMFSNNMLKKRSFNPSAQISCRKHTTAPVTEMVCSSCRKHKALDFFSKNERKASGGQRCRACVEWIEGDEVGYVPLPAPNSLRDDEEASVYKGNPKNTAIFHGDEDDDYITEAQIGPTPASWVGRSRDTTGAWTGDGLTADNLQHFTEAGKSYSVPSRGGESYHASSAPTDSASTAGTERTARPSNVRQFNAYGPDGQVQKRQAGTAASVTSGTSRSTTGSKDWARPPSRRYPPALPRHLEHENPETVGYCAYDDDDSSDGC